MFYISFITNCNSKKSRETGGVSLINRGFAFSNECHRLRTQLFSIIALQGLLRIDRSPCVLYHSVLRVGSIEVFMADRLEALFYFLFCVTNGGAKMLL